MSNLARLTETTEQECWVCRGKGFFGGESPASILQICEHCNGTGVEPSTTPTEIDRELRLAILKVTGKYTPNKVLREMSEEYWKDIAELETAIKQAFSEIIIGEDEPEKQMTNKDSDLKLFSVMRVEDQNRLRNLQRQALWGNHEGGTE